MPAALECKDQRPVLYIQGIEKGGKPAVTLLTQQFDFWCKEEGR